MRSVYLVTTVLWLLALCGHGVDLSNYAFDLSYFRDEMRKRMHSSPLEPAKMKRPPKTSASAPILKDNNTHSEKLKNDPKKWNILAKSIQETPRRGSAKTCPEKACTVAPVAGEIGKETMKRQPKISSFAPVAKETKAPAKILQSSASKVVRGSTSMREENEPKKCDLPAKTSNQTTKGGSTRTFLKKACTVAPIVGEIDRVTTKRPPKISSSAPITKETKTPAKIIRSSASKIVQGSTSIREGNEPKKCDLLSNTSNQTTMSGSYKTCPKKPCAVDPITGEIDMVKKRQPPKVSSSAPIAKETKTPAKVIRGSASNVVKGYNSMQGGDCDTTCRQPPTYSPKASTYQKRQRDLNSKYEGTTRTTMEKMRPKAARRIKKGRIARNRRSKRHPQPAPKPSTFEFAPTLNDSIVASTWDEEESSNSMPSMAPIMLKSQYSSSLHPTIGGDGGGGNDDLDYHEPAQFKKSTKTKLVPKSAGIPEEEEEEEITKERRR